MTLRPTARRGAAAGPGHRTAAAGCRLCTTRYIFLHDMSDSLCTSESKIYSQGPVKNENDLTAHGSRGINAWGGRMLRGFYSVLPTSASPASIAVGGEASLSRTV